MAERITRTPHLSYRGHKPKISCLMDPAMVQTGESFTAKQGIKAVDMAELPKDADGTPYVDHNGEDTAGLWTQEIYGLPVPSAKVTKLIRLDKYRGNYLEYGNAHATVRQCHFSSLLVAHGQTITPNTMIGYEGATGAVSGKHLHTSILIDGKYVDPRWYVTGLIAFPDDAPDEYLDAKKASDGFFDWAVADRFETAITPTRYEVATPQQQSLRVRQAPGIDKAQVSLINHGTIISIDKLAKLPDKQVWGRLAGKPWHWVCLKRGTTFAKPVKDWPAKLTNGFYFVRSSATDARSQTGAFTILKNARTLANKNGQKVFAPDGSEVL